MNSWFREVFSRTDEMIINGVPLRVMAPTDHLLFLVFHAFKHFISKGFGIRLMLDTLLYMEKYYASIDWAYLQAGLRDVGADSFFTDLITVGNQYLGFELPMVGRLTCPNELLEDMFRMGTFGNSTKEDASAGVFMNMAVSGEKKQKKHRNRTVDMLRMLFPSWRTWLTLRPYLADKPWMLPVEWFKRIGKYLKKKDKVDYVESWNIAERRMALLKKYGVI